MKRIGKNETTEMAPVKKCFVGLETALYLLFLALDAFSAGGDGVKYLTIVVCLLAALDFDGAFTVFHSIFFPGKDNWLFDPVTDPVILILPEAFFRNCAIAIVTVLLTVCIMLVVTGRK